MDESQPMKSMRYTRTVRHTRPSTVRANPLKQLLIRIPFRRATLKIEDLTHYLATKAKFANDRCLKRANFKVAIDQIEAAIAGDDNAAGPFADEEVDNDGDTTIIDASMIDPSGETDAIEAAVDAETSIAEAVADEATIKEEQATTVASTAAKTVAPKGKRSIAATSTAKKATAPALPEASSDKKDAAIADADVSKLPQVTTAVVELTEVTSRSGRKIKLKRYRYEDDEEALVATPPAHASPTKRKAAVLSSAAVEQSEPTAKQLKVRVVLSGADYVRMLFVPLPRMCVHPEQQCVRNSIICQTNWTLDEQSYGRKNICRAIITYRFLGGKHRPHVFFFN